MPTRKQYASILGAFALAAGALVATGTPAANAATPTCETLVGAVNSSNRIIYRIIKSGEVQSEKLSSKALSAPVQYLLSGFGEKISGGSRVDMTAYQYGQKPRLLRVTNLTASSTLSVAGLKTQYASSFNVRLLANSGTYYVYGVDSSGALKQWTRYLNSNNQLFYGSPKTIATGMSGLKTLTYAWTFKIDGAYRDFLYATTKTGGLKQIQVPWLKPGSEKVTSLATTGFADVTGVSPSFCGDNPRYVALVTIDAVGNSARWFTMASQTAPSAASLIDRGPIAGDHDWNLHAVG